MVYSMNFLDVCPHDSEESFLSCEEMECLKCLKYYYLHCKDEKSGMKLLNKKSYQRKRLTEEHKYFVTFTVDPKKGVTEDLWVTRLATEMRRKFVKSFQLVIENRETNMHAHASVITNKHLKRADFHTYEKFFGHVDLRKVENDRGVDEYLGISMGVVPFTSPDEIN